MIAATLADCLRTISQESGGAVAVHIVFQGDLRDLITGAMVGDPDAALLLPLVRQGIRQIRTAPRRAPALCGCCPRPIRTRFVLAIALPERNDPSHGIAIGLCLRCAGDGDVAQAQQAAGKALRGIRPDGRLATVTHPHGGRA